MVKDFSEMFRNRLTLVITVAVVIAIPILYLLLPSEAGETLVIGVDSPGLEGLFSKLGNTSGGLKVLPYNGTEDLKEAVGDGSVSAGISLPADFVQTLLRGGKPEVGLLFSSSTPKEARESIQVLLEELSFAITGRKLPAELRVEVLGEDLAGKQLPFRDQAKPMWITLVLIVELFSLSFLMVEETQTGAIHAILVTPTTTGQVFAAKTIVGTTLAFVEGFLVLMLMGESASSLGVLLPNLLLGALLSTGFAFLVASVSKDVMSSFSWIMLIYVVLLIPPMSVVFPSISSPAVKVLPSYYVADAFNQVLNYGRGLGDIWQGLVVLAVFDIAILVAGTWALRRRFR